MTRDNVTDIVGRLREMAPSHPPDLIWGERSTRDLSNDIRDAADIIAKQKSDLATIGKQLENAREALAIRDKSTEPCPADKRHLGDKLCPKCGSSSAGPCWLKVSADSTFVDTAREALKGQPC